MINFLLNKIIFNFLILKKIQINSLKKVLTFKKNNHLSKSNYNFLFQNHIFSNIFRKNCIYFYINYLNNFKYSVNKEYNNFFEKYVIKNFFFKNSIYFNYFDNNIFFFYKIFNTFYLKPSFFKKNKESKKIKHNSIKHNTSFVNNLLKMKTKSFNFSNKNKTIFYVNSVNCVNLFFNNFFFKVKPFHNNLKYYIIIKNNLAFMLKNDYIFFKKIVFLSFKKKRITTNTTKFILNRDFTLIKIFPKKVKKPFKIDFLRITDFSKNNLKINFIHININYYDYSPYYLNFFNFKTLKRFNFNFNKKFNKSSVTLNRNIIFLNDMRQNYNFPILNKKTKVLSNKFINKNLNYFNFGDNNFKKINLNEKYFNIYNYNNHYPVILNRNFNIFIEKFKKGLSLNYYNYMQIYTINFLETLINKKIFLRVTNNFFKKYPFKNYILKISEENRYNNPIFFKKFLLVDFIEIIWYSFYLKDLKMFSNLISRIMESMHFRHHRKFLLFFQNFMKKYYSIFITILRIKGFFFDIRGKVGVAGNSKKRHFFFKFGNLGKSTKIDKIDFNQNLVRTPSGVLGLTYILNY